MVVRKHHMKERRFLRSTLMNYHGASGRGIGRIIVLSISPQGAGSETLRD